MAEDAPPSAPALTPKELQDEAERQMRDIGQRFGALPQDDDELLRLLEEAETWLSRVDQSPPEGMYDTLRPTMDVLITNELLEHPDPNVKVAVTSCLTEVTRITAPEAPYDDDVMKDVFKRIVEAFAGLDDVNSPSFLRRVAILDSVARVRCCVLMLDLDLDHLILDMFRHFFKAAFMNHSGQFIGNMASIMIFVIQESDDIQPELASCLLQNMKKEAQENQTAFELGERIAAQCKDKLKPAFVELLKDTSLDEYNSIVTLLCQDASDAKEENDVASKKDTAAEGKISERSVSDESPQESSKLEQDVNCPGQDDTPPSSTPTAAISTDTPPSSTPTAAISNGGAPVDGVKAPDGPASSKQSPELPSVDEKVQISDLLISDDKEKPEPVTTEIEKPSDINSKGNQKLDSFARSEMTGNSKVHKELSPEKNDGDNKQRTETSNRAAEDSTKHVDTKPAVLKPKRGRPPATKSQEKKPVGKKQGSNLESAKVDSVSDSGGRATRRLSLTKDDAKSSSSKAAEGESGKKQQKTSLKLQKEETVSDKDTDDDISLKEMVSPTKMDKTKRQQEDSGGSKRKRMQEAEQTPLSKKSKMLDENLVGSRIKVWWPEDKKFYVGVVESFIASSKKHKVAYDDGDVEKLFLREERWEFIDKEQDSDPDAASEMSRGRRGKGSSSQQIKAGKTGTPQSGNDGRDPPKKRGRPRTVRSSNDSPNADSTVTSARLKGKGAEKDTQGTPKTGGNIKKEGGRLSRSPGKAKDSIIKASSKDAAGSSDNSDDDAGSEDRNIKDEVKSNEAVDESKTNGLSTKRKPKEKEGETSEEKGSAKTSTRKKRRRKSHN